MELSLDYEYSCIIIIRLFPKFSHGFLIEVYYSLRLLKIEYSASSVHVIIKIYFDAFNYSSFSLHFQF